ncbi:type II toxin-antitoxin system VapB family antitoxin [Caulobacter sp. DWR1-3-2b1]|uniref:type II toxin-antitoxin system VapB family antitoxin n=1 Tax=Caulobacter sp. DWR1-3-2b1 TaxID=2804670 RepID=UPI003CF28335
MPFHVRDPEADAMLRSYAEEKRVGITDAIKLAVTRAREADAAARTEKLAKMRAISARIAALPDTGLKADKAFFDEMYDD